MQSRGRGEAVDMVVARPHPYYLSSFHPDLAHGVNAMPSGALQHSGNIPCALACSPDASPPPK